MNVLLRCAGGTCRHHGQVGRRHWLPSCFDRHDAFKVVLGHVLHVLMLYCISRYLSLTARCCAALVPHSTVQVAWLVDSGLSMAQKASQRPLPAPPNPPPLAGRFHLFFIRTIFLLSFGELAALTPSFRDSIYRDNTKTRCVVGSFVMHHNASLHHGIFDKVSPNRLHDLHA